MAKDYSEVERREEPKGSASLISRIAGVVRGIALRAVAGSRRVLLSGFKVQ